jgi:thiamine-monophosphate kinase
VLPPNPTTAPPGGGAWREDVALERIAALLGGPSARADGGPFGDDAATLAVPRRVVVCVDAGVAGVHLDAASFPLSDLGYRTAVAALSDLAAVGARPLAALVALCAPGDVDVVEVESRAVDACAAAACPVVGGDLSRSATTTVAVTALGAPGPAGPVPRSGGRPGDAVLVTGPLGAAAAARRLRAGGADLDDTRLGPFRRPVPRLDAGAVAATCGATAMLDVSDGLARDLRRLAAASGVSVALARVPVADGATLDEALGGGEDYELCFTHPDAGQVAAAFAAAGIAAPVEIGSVAAGSGCTLEGRALPDVGWRH